MRKILAVLIVVTMLGTLVACGNNQSPSVETTPPQSTNNHSHLYEDADCTSPKRCSCGSTLGDPLGHQWVEGNCTTPVTCSVCEVTKGLATGHRWTDADCTNPKTCSVCKATEGKAIGHRYDNAGTCEVCFSQLSISKVILNKSSLEMKKGDSVTLNVTYEPKYEFYRTITWTSSNESVATVSWTGEVTAVGTGTAIISATEEGGKTATCTVTVSKSPLSVDASIGITMMASNTFVGQGVSVSVEATGGSENYVAYNIKLYRDDEFIDEVNESEMFVTPVLGGAYKAEVYVKDSEGTEARTTITTTIG